MNLTQRQAVGISSFLIGSIILGSGAFAYTRSRQARLRAEAQSALYAAEKVVTGEFQALATKKFPNSKDGMLHASFVPCDVTVEYSQSIEKLRAITKDFPRSVQAHEALLRIANLYFDHKQYEKAAPIFAEAAHIAPSAFEKAADYAAEGTSYENCAQYTQAIDAFTRSLHMGEGSVRADVMMALARVYSAAKDNNTARSMYDNIVAEFPDSDEAKMANLRRSMLPPELHNP